MYRCIFLRICNSSLYLLLTNLVKGCPPFPPKKTIFNCDLSCFFPIFIYPFYHLFYSSQIYSGHLLIFLNYLAYFFFEHLRLKLTTQNFLFFNIRRSHCCPEWSPTRGLKGASLLSLPSSQKHMLGHCTCLKTVLWFCWVCVSFWNFYSKFLSYITMLMYMLFFFIFVTNSWFSCYVGRSPSAWNSPLELLRLSTWPGMYQLCN